MNGDAGALDETQETVDSSVNAESDEVSRVLSHTHTCCYGSAYDDKQQASAKAATKAAVERLHGGQAVPGDEALPDRAVIVADFTRAGEEDTTHSDAPRPPPLPGSPLAADTATTAAPDLAAVAAVAPSLDTCAVCVFFFHCVVVSPLMPPCASMFFCSESIGNGSAAPQGASSLAGAINDLYDSEQVRLAARQL